jgi:hypothetical protein
MSILKGVGLQFDESMSGHLGKGETDPSKGAAVGRRQETKIRFDVRITISDLNRFLKVSQHEAELSGRVTWDVIGDTFTIFDGTFNLFSIDPEMGMRQMVYPFGFMDADGHVSCLKGEKYHARN